jgi:hypothetical protein
MQDGFVPHNNEKLLRFFGLSVVVEMHFLLLGGKLQGMEMRPLFTLLG